MLHVLLRISWMLHQRKTTGQSLQETNVERKPHQGVSSVDLQEFTSCQVALAPEVSETSQWSGHALVCAVMDWCFSCDRPCLAWRSGAHAGYDALPGLAEATFSAALGP